MVVSYSFTRRELGQPLQQSYIARMLIRRTIRAQLLHKLIRDAFLLQIIQQQIVQIRVDYITRHGVYILVPITVVDANLVHAERVVVALLLLTRLHERAQQTHSGLTSHQIDLKRRLRFHLTNIRFVHIGIYSGLVFRVHRVIHIKANLYSEKYLYFV